MLQLIIIRILIIMFSLNSSTIAFSIGNFNIYWYGVLFAISLLVGWYISNNIVKQLNNLGYSNFTLNEFDSFLFIGLIIVIISSRLGHVLFYDFQFYKNNPLEIFMIRHGGLAFHGGLLGLIVYVYLYCKRKNISWLLLLDILSISASAGLITGRLANFFNQELVGKIWASEYGVVFPLVDTFPRYPTQLYEALTEGLLAFFIQILYLNINKWKSFGTGRYAVIFGITYSTSRFIIEFYKDVEEIFITNNILLTVGQILCILMFILSLILYSIGNKKMKKNYL